MGERSFFVDPGTVSGDTAEIRGPIAHQIGHVLRLRPGDFLELLDNSGDALTARIDEITREGVLATITGRRRPETEPPVRLELYQSLLKGEKMEWVLQKGTEIGLSRFVPVLSERCVSRPSEADLSRKLERWRSIVREAAEQSGRAVLPEVAPLVDFNRACSAAAAADFAVMAWEGERTATLRGLIRQETEAWTGRTERPRIAVLIGPEGGFSEREAEIARTAGVTPAGLGPRILRAETAALVAATVVLWEAGGLGG